MKTVMNAKGETLWHIQNRNICSDGSAYDLFYWSKHEPTQDDLKKLFVEDYGEEGWELDEWLTSSEVYAVCAYNSDEI